jgi:catecholate siderophore receptor
MIEHGGGAMSLALVLALAATPAQAENKDAVQPDRDYLAGEIVVTAQANGYELDDGSSGTKTPTPIIDVPQTVTALTRDQLDDQNLRSLNDALRFVPGVSLKTGEGHRDEVFIRGQVTTADFYLDGLRDDAQYYRPLYNIERVEVLKGANALIFGRGAGGGAVNRVAKQAALGRTKLGAATSLDTFGGFDIAGDVSLPIADVAAVRLNAFYEEFASNRDVYDGRFIGINPAGTLQLGEATRLLASYTYDDDRRIVDRGLPSFRGRPLRGNDDRFIGDPRFNDSTVQAHIARARLEHDFNSNLSANLAVQYATYDKYYGNILPGAASDTDGDGIADAVQVTGYDSATDRENLMGQANLIWNGNTGPIGHTVLVGAEFTRQDTLSKRDRVRFATTRLAEIIPLAQSTTIPAFALESQLGSRSELEVASLYLQDQVELAEWLELVVGARYDRFTLDSINTLEGFAAERTDEKLSPRVGLILKPQPNLSLYASYTESFLPASGDQFTVLSRTTVQLEPEEFRNLEAGVKWAPRRDILATAAVFRLDRSNTPSINDQGMTVLTGESRVQGAELSLAGSLTRRLHVNVGYTYLNGEIRSALAGVPVGRELQQLPEHQVGAWARYDFSDRLGLGLGVVHQGSQFTTYSNTVRLPAYTRVDAAAFFTVTDRVSVQLNVENLTDAAYYPSAHNDNNIQPGRPLNARLGVRLNY